MNDNGHAPYSDVHSRVVWQQFKASTQSLGHLPNRKVMRSMPVVRSLLFWSLMVLAIGLCIGKMIDEPAPRAQAQVRG
jgi:hypothetical protein